MENIWFDKVLLTGLALNCYEPLHTVEAERNQMFDSNSTSTTMATGEVQVDEETVHCLSS